LVSSLKVKPASEASEVVELEDSIGAHPTLTAAVVSVDEADDEEDDDDDELGPATTSDHDSVTVHV